MTKSSVYWRAVVQRQHSSYQRGFSLMEILITMLIISFALLGAAALQAYAMRLNQGGQYRSQAILLVASMAERMEANKNGALTGQYGKRAGAANCLTGACTPTQMADFDETNWAAEITASGLPQAVGTIVNTVAGNLTTYTPATYTITLSWVERASDTTNAGYDAASSLGATSTGVGERFSYTATRTIAAPK